MTCLAAFFMVTEELKHIVELRLKSLPGLKGSVVLVSVSGGPDSMALLHLLIWFSSVYCFKIVVCTVNHRIRSEEESGGDADFVEKFCKDAGISCRRIDLSPFQLRETIEMRRGGVEDGARFLRYRILDDLREDLGAGYIFLGHNKNDHLETLIMRFLQGSSASGKNGISFLRDWYCRPLLGVEKKLILEYLAENRISFRTDKTNEDTSYFRNRIRRVLVPLLNEYFPGWDKALISGAEKSLEEEKALECFPGIPAWEVLFLGNSSAFLRVPCDSYIKLPKAVKIRLLFKGCNLLSSRERIPYPLIEEFAEKKPGTAFSSGSGFTAGFSGKWYYLGLLLEKNMEKIYSFAIRKGEKILVNDVEYCAFGMENRGVIFRDIAKEGMSVIGILGPFTGKISFYNNREGNSIIFSNGREKPVKKLLSDGGIPPVLRPFVPCFEATGYYGAVKGVLGCVFGFRNWLSLPDPALFFKDVDQKINTDNSGTYVLIARKI